jgi:hypothetical protein
VGARTSSSFGTQGSTRRGLPSPVRTGRPLYNRPCFAGVTPVTIDVWLGQVTAGFTVCIPSVATAPSRANRRMVGSGTLASFSSKAGKPSMLITMTWALEEGRCPDATQAADAASRNCRRFTGTTISPVPRRISSLLIVLPFLVPRHLDGLELTLV